MQVYQFCAVEKMLVHVAFRLIHISKGLPLFNKAWDILVSEVAPRPEKSERTIRQRAILNDSVSR